MVWIPSDSGKGKGKLKEPKETVQATQTIGWFLAQKFLFLKEKLFYRIFPTFLSLSRRNRDIIVIIRGSVVVIIIVDFIGIIGFC